jgi:N-acyl homoserine lactone hydrolase
VIRRVSVVSTGSVSIRPQHERSTGSPQFWWLMTSRRWTKPLPINVYVIEHDAGIVVFDTGQDRRSVTDPDYFPRGFIGWAYSRLARFSIAPQDTLTAQLAQIDVSASQVTTVILSHLHQDHIGGLAELTGAEIIVSDAEWNDLDRANPEARGLMTKHIRIPGLRWKRVTPTASNDESILPLTSSFDVLGDGSLVLLPTPGHTPGSLSLLLRQEGLPTMLFVGDLTYDVQLLEAEKVPGVGNPRLLRESSRAVNALRERYPDLVVLAAHDPAAAGMLEAALDATGRP